MAGNVRCSEALLRSRSEASRALLSTADALHLFSNSFDPSSATPLSAFIECSFAGYAPISLVGKFPTPAEKIKSGVWGFTSAVLTFTPTAASLEKARGFWVQKGSDWLVCGVFPSPVTIAAFTPIPLWVRLEEWALSLLLVA